MSRSVTMMTIDDAEHYSPEQRAAIIASYPPHEREARTKGIPSLGSGRIFPVAEQELQVGSFAIPKSWPQIISVDFGWEHPFAAVRQTWDRDNDCWYVIACYRKSEATPVLHAAAIKPWGDWIPIAWPHDGYQHDKGSGLALAEQYRSQGLEMLPEHATHEEGGFGTEAGIMDMLDRMHTGRFKVFAHLSEWFEEFRLYHREEGRIVKKNDDLMSASRIGLMMRRHAIVEPRKTDWKPIERLSIV